MFSVASTCAMAFGQYVALESPEEHRGSEHLLDYAWTWLAYDGGAQACGNDFGLFLCALMISAEGWRTRPEFFVNPNGPDTPPVQILSLDCPHCTEVLDPHFFALMAADPERLNRSHAEAMAEEDEASRQALASRPEGYGQPADS